MLCTHVAWIPKGLNPSFNLLFVGFFGDNIVCEADRWLWEWRLEKKIFLLILQSGWTEFILY